MVVEAAAETAVAVEADMAAEVGAEVYVPLLLVVEEAVVPTAHLAMAVLEGLVGQLVLVVLVLTIQMAAVEAV